MPRDGSLRIEFRKHLRDAQWSSIETGLSEGGVPDSEYMFLGGIGGWIEHKKTAANAVVFQPLQVGWLSRRARLGGRCFVAVRQTKTNDLYLFSGADAAAVHAGGLRAAVPLGRWCGGPSGWDWAAIRSLLTL
jgi:hypothetical protein